MLSIFFCSNLCRADAQRLSDQIKPGTGTIEGTVLDQNGLPVRGARVYAEPIDGVNTNHGTRLNSAVSDTNGKFVLPGVVAGLNLVMAGKEQEGFCNTLFAALTEDVAVVPRVVVTAGEVSRGVAVVLSTCAKLSGTVSDATTGMPMPGAQIRLIREDDPKLDVLIASNRYGKFEFTVPNIPYTLEVSAPGYEGWKRSGIRLAAKGMADLEIRLRKGR
jgi:hypothetical protein